MKKMIHFSSFAFLLSFFFIAGQTFAQTAIPKADFNADLVISIDPGTAVATAYTIDISKMTFKNEDAAKMFFRAMRDNLIHGEVNYTEKTATLFLHTEYQKEWTVADWNTYLAKNAERYRLTYNRVNIE